MATTLRDEQGNPIQLTDEYGNQVQLTDEHGNPVQITGIATTKQPPTLGNVSSDQVPVTGLLPSTAMSEDATKGTGIHETGQHGGVAADQGGHKKEEQEEISSTSSSGSSEDDGRGGRKGLKEKIKEKLTCGKHMEEHGQTAEVHTTATGPAGEQCQEHEKRSVMEKIKEKLPGHHSHH
ncbi:PREDICTED: embryogenic cell protein 40-like [Populus euphratica]|uniref:Embryogenic cell protein 40-like n=1 Tax=Populus euphratica TaxID=75702 RepID=A0AAJ6XZY2_POPEU|nr:PREDICTED: embryogenic cell protein 40-like [Populus euphratica]